MKKIISKLGLLGLCALVGFSITSCSNNDPAPTKQSTETVKTEEEKVPSKPLVESDINTIALLKEKGLGQAFDKLSFKVFLKYGETLPGEAKYTDLIWLLEHDNDKTITSAKCILVHKLNNTRSFLSTITIHEPMEVGKLLGGFYDVAITSSFGSGYVGCDEEDFGVRDAFLEKLELPKDNKYVGLSSYTIGDGANTEFSLKVFSLAGLHSYKIVMPTKEAPDDYIPLINNGEYEIKENKTSYTDTINIDAYSK